MVPVGNWAGCSAGGLQHASWGGVIAIAIIVVFIRNGCWDSLHQMIRSLDSRKLTAVTRRVEWIWKVNMTEIIYFDSLL